MKPILLLALIALTCHAHAADNENTAKNKVTHHVQFLFGNYVSGSVASSNNTNFAILPPQYSSNIKGIYTQFYDYGYVSAIPLYTYSVGFEYKAEFSERFGFRTGINYFTYGSIVTVGGEDDDQNIVFLKEYLFTSSLLIPAHLMIFKKKSKGRLVFTMGPDLYLSIHSYGRATATDLYNDNLPNYRFHSHSTGTNFFKDGSLGFTAGIGYEKKISDKLAVEFMPDFRVLNIVPFDFQDEGTHLYQHYVINMALGLSTYITFY
jgi:hypothetical protein